MRRGAFAVGISCSSSAASVLSGSATLSRVQQRKASAPSAMKKQSTARGATSAPSASNTPTVFSSIAADALARNHEDLQYEGWIDDDKHELAQLQRHRASAEYRELHRPTNTNASMGLFGGEPGFEKSHRVWVDPDKPHLKYVYNSGVVSRNIRYTRYGFFKREMHLLDIDKLVRHGRMLPLPDRLLTDFLYQRVPLKDRDCAALLRYARTNLTKVSDDMRSSVFGAAVEMFERMLTTNIPPVEVGVEAHTEMILCCAVAKNWSEGWEQYRSRALELEQEYLDATEREAAERLDSATSTLSIASTSATFVLGSKFFDACLRLCVECEKPEEGLNLFAEFLERGVLPQASSLQHVLILLSMMPVALGERSMAAVPASKFASLVAQSDDVWGLFEVFGLARDVQSIVARIRCCALLNAPQGALDALRVAHQLKIPLTEQCYHWTLYALRHTPDLGDFVLDLTSQAQTTGLMIDYRHITYVLMYCAKQHDGDAALAAYQQHVLGQDMNLSAEMLVLLLQSFRRSKVPTIDMLQAAEDAWRRFHRVGSGVDVEQESVEELMMLCGQLGASATAFSYLKEAIGKGCAITAIMLNSVLKANAIAAAPNGSAALAGEVVELFGFLKVIPTIDTAEALLACHDAHGSTKRSQAFTNALVTYIKSHDDEADAVGDATDASRPAVEADVFPDALDIPPHLLRRLGTEFRIDVNDIALRKLGQTAPLATKAQQHVGALDRVQPFGYWPGIVDAK